MLKQWIVAIAIGAGLMAGAQAQDAKRAIPPIAGDVYRFQNNFHFNIFVITDAGVVVTDPINADAAAWLKAQIAKRTDKPITHLIYSHSHGDHASGGVAFGPVANVIAHSNAPAAIDGVQPTVRFDSEMSFEHGGKTFELTHVGPGHGQDLIAVVVRPENVAFIVDAVSAKRLPYRDFPNANVDDWANQVRKAQTLSFNIFAPGHGAMGTKGDVTLGRVYMEKLRAAVLAELRAGKSAADIENNVLMEAYKNWGSYKQWRALNVRGMARFLTESGAVNQ